MPYKDLKSANAAILGIVPPVDLAQANMIASVADGIAAGDAPPEAGKEWPIAIEQFKKAHEAKGDMWVKKTGTAEADPVTPDVSVPAIKPVPAVLPEPVLKPTPDSIRLEMLPIAKFDPVTLELVDVDPTQGIQALVGMSTKWADGDPLIVQQYVFTGDAWNDQSAAKWAKAKGSKKGEPWDAKPASEKPVEPPPDAVQAERHYNQPRKHQRTLAEIKQLRKRVELLLKEIDGQSDMPILPGDEPPAEGDKVAALQAAFEDFCASVGEILGLPGAPVADGTGMGERLAESFGGDMMHLALEDAPLSEAGDPAAKPLSMLVELIQPGWGNAQDNHYYPASMLKDCASQFVGKKMYESDHRPEQKSTRSWVSTITEIKGFSDGGAPVARVVVHDPGFAERVRNLGAAGLLDKMECSILADGRASTGFEENGRKGKRVDAITSVESVDWVTRAGAGGHAAELAERGGANMGAMLTAAVRQSLVAASKLPEAARVRLAEGDYTDEATLAAAIDREREYIKTLTGSGQPFGNAPGTAPALTEADRLKAQDAVINRYMR